MSGVIPTLAARDYACRCMAPSICPDTGQPVRSWALEGEEISSPYTGRRYRQGPTGYFGPKERDASGRITAFGGDPLKYDLPAVTARLLQNPDDVGARAFVSIPGHLRQQYHFAAINWTRFYGLLADRMDGAWLASLRSAVADYRESRHPSDGEREHTMRPATPFDLVGEEGYLLGGNPADGGTENHKTQWRTSGLLYAQWLGPDGRVSGYPSAVAEARITERLMDFLQRLLITGNGEYDSTTYIFYTLAGYLNLFDFSPRPETRELARMTLDWFVGTYGLKLFNGTLTGAVKRGFSHGFQLTGTDRLFHGWVPCGQADPLAGDGYSLHLATTGYRPNRILWNVIRKEVALPFEARMARPSYHLDAANRFQETFYCDHDFAMGSVAMTAIDNPNQQTVWSLSTRADDGHTLVFGGGQPRYPSPEGHRACDQVFQHRNCLILMTADHPEAGPALQALPRDLSLPDRWARSASAAEAWFFAPRAGTEIRMGTGHVALQAGSARIFLRSLGQAPFELDWPSEPARSALPKEIRETLERYRIVVFPGKPAGFVLEVLSTTLHASLAAFESACGAESRLMTGDFAASGRVAYRTLAGTDLEMAFDPRALRCRASVKGQPVDWDGWCAGNAIESPYIQSGAGKMQVCDGRDGYRMSADSGCLRWA
jgi:hypothetical protein